MVEPVGFAPTSDITIIKKELQVSQNSKLTSIDFEL